jgi:hypothetical protein
MFIRAKISQVGSEFRLLWSWCKDKRSYIYSISVHLTLLILFAHLTFSQSGSGGVIKGSIVAPKKSESPKLRILDSVGESAQEKEMDSVNVKWQPTTHYELPKTPMLMPALTSVEIHNDLFRSEGGKPEFEKINFSQRDGGLGINPTDGIGGGKKLFGIGVGVEKLGVVLDISGSMEQVLPRVTKEIRGQFPDAKFVFNEGCSFLHEERKPFQQISLSEHEGDRFGGRTVTIKDLSDPYYMTKFMMGMWPRVLPEWHETARRVGFENAQDSDFFYDMSEAVGYLVENTDVDGVWLFADFEDCVDENCVVYLSKTVKKRPIKIYIHSVEKRPTSSLISLCKSSKGDVVIRPLK